jgi:hypothetical protein
MRLTRLFGAALGTGFLFLAASSGAMAYDNWDRDHYRHDHDRYAHERYEHERYEHYRHDRPVVVHERPVVVERGPTFVAPQPMYVAPMQQGPSGLNLNFNIPLGN